jgi:hypothetical protein
VLLAKRYLLKDYDRKVYRNRKVPLLDRAKRVGRLAWAIEYMNQPMVLWSKVSVSRAHNAEMEELFLLESLVEDS